MADAKYIRSCSLCSAEFSANRKNKIYCSKACCVKAFRQNNPEKYKAHRETERQKRQPKPRISKVLHCHHVIAWRANLKKQNKPEKSQFCLVCNAQLIYDFGRPRVYCSNKCLRKNRKNFESYKTARSKRKALERGAKVGESINPKAIFSRDGWKCQMCGKLTPEQKRGTCSKIAPELDHIVPLSKGGTHTPDNVQTLCRSCNGWKSNKILPAQQGLFTALVG